MTRVLELGWPLASIKALPLVHGILYRNVSETLWNGTSDEDEFLSGAVEPTGKV